MDTVSRCKACGQFFGLMADPSVKYFGPSWWRFIWRLPVGLRSRCWKCGYVWWTEVKP